jgi:hypothetical protein
MMPLLLLMMLIYNNITLIRGSNVILSARLDILLVQVKQVINGGI